MRVRAAFDLSAVPHALGGVSRYLLSLAQGLVGVSGRMDTEVVTVDVPAVHSGIPGHEIATVSVPTPFYLGVPLLRRIPIRRGWEAASRARRISRATGSPGVYHHSGIQPVCPPGAASVVTVYDLSALENPGWHTAETVEYCRIEAEMLRSGSFACAISGWTASRLQELLGIPEDRIHVTGGAAADRFTPGEPSPGTMTVYGLKPDGYMLHVGNYVPRKNIPFLIDAYRRSRQRGLDLPLVLAGAGGWGGISVEEGKGVRVLRGVPDSHMPDLYRGARVLLLPSEYEGLGLPILEALACGTPVISSDAAALPETLGGSGRILPAGDTESWTSAMEAMKDRREVDELRRMAALSRRKSWTDIALDLLGFYRRIAEA